MNLSQRTSALESRLAGGGSASAGATPNPSGPWSASAGVAAPGAGGGSSGGASRIWGQWWSPQDWDEWRGGSWRQSDSSGGGVSS
eukprot:11855553-Alexandrium_andersonii.AAC.1